MVFSSGCCHASGTRLAISMNSRSRIFLNYFRWESCVVNCGILAKECVRVVYIVISELG